MSKKKKSFLPSMEILIILVFFISFLVFAIPQCRKKQLAYQKEAALEEKLATSDSATLDIAVDSATLITPTTPSSAQPSTVIVAGATRLYVTIDSLNMRSGPGLNNKILQKLDLYEEVLFLNEITPYTEKISLGNEIADEPWVKIQTQSGQPGWVYGAGVYYYKRKRLGMD